MKLADQLQMMFGPPDSVGCDGRLKWACPFPDHQDDKPSFHLLPKDSSFLKRRWYCHGCGRSGDGADLLMQLYGISFPEARRAILNGDFFSFSPASIGPNTKGETMKTRTLAEIQEQAAERVWNPTEDEKSTVAIRRHTDEYGSAVRIGYTGLRDGNTFFIDCHSLDHPERLKDILSSVLAALEVGEVYKIQEPESVGTE